MAKASRPSSTLTTDADSNEENDKKERYISGGVFALQDCDDTIPISYQMNDLPFLSRPL